MAGEGAVRIAGETAGTLPAPLAGAGQGAGAHVTILMATCNGAAYLAAQLDSIAAQSHANWSLRIGDDGSTDATRAIIAAFRRRHPERAIELVEGPRRGAAANFLALLQRGAPPRGHVAFSDQDDIWLPHKLRRALQRIAAHPPGRPVLYGSRTIIADHRGRDRRTSRRHPRPLGFANALVQNVIAGNTAVLNPAAVELMRRARAPAEVPFHDWWLYLMVSAAGGTVLLDERPGLLYRQHAGNMLGASIGPRDKLERLRRLASSEIARWNRAHIGALEANRALLTPAAARQLAVFSATHRARGLPALWRLAGTPVYRQSGAELLALYWAALHGRF